MKYLFIALFFLDVLFVRDYAMAQSSVQPIEVLTDSVGLAKEAKQDSLNTKIDTLNAKDFSTSANQATGNGYLVDIKGYVDQLEGYVDGLESQFSTLNAKDFSTSAKQDTGNTSLSSIDSKTPALVSGRQPVDGSGVNQPVLVSKAAITDTIESGAINYSAVMDLKANGVNEVTLIYPTSSWTGDIQLYVSADGTTYQPACGTDKIQNLKNQCGYSQPSGSIFPKTISHDVSQFAYAKFGGTINANTDITMIGTHNNSFIDLINPISISSSSVADSRENDFVSIDGVDQIKSQGCDGRGIVYVEISGTWVGTIEFRGGIGNLDISEVLLQAYVLNADGTITGTPVTNTTSGGRFYIPCAGHSAINFYSTSWTSGTANLTSQSSVAHHILKTDVLRLPAVALSQTGTANDVDANITGGTLTANLGTLNGAATAANQTTGNSSLSSIDTKTPALVSGRVPVDGSGVTQPVSGTITANLGTLNGAATAAKQPALGTAGSASSDVLTVQGIASMTPLKVDGSAVTQPVSGTLTANIGTTNGLALDATLTGGTARSKITDGTDNADVTAASTAAVATDKAVVVNQSPNGGNPCNNPSATLVSATGSTSGTAAVQIVALSGSTKIYVCSLSVVGVSGTNPTFSLVQGTGSNCATGQTTVVQAWTTTAGSIYAFAPPVSVGVAGNALCYLDGGTTPVQRYTLTYVQQ